MKVLWVLCILCLVLPVAALDREAFTFTRYDLTVNLDPGQQRLGIRGTIRLRNDSDSPQQNLVLQVSSSLHWASIRIGGKPAGFITQTYNSDVDHTGGLSEAIIRLPAALAPKESLEIELGYEGVIPQDTTRLTQIGMPAEAAKHADWDQISPAFTAVRGIGFVAWYPIATEAANMVDPRSVSEAVGRWKKREASTEMQINLCQGPTKTILPLLMNDTPSGRTGGDTAGNTSACAAHHFTGETVPVFVAASFLESHSREATILYINEHKSGADNYALALDQVAPSVTKWFGEHALAGEAKPLIVELPDSEASPFQSGNMLLTPFTDDDTGMLLSAVQLLTHVAFSSPRPWISEGLARYAAVRYVEQEKSRKSALSYMQSHRAALVEAEGQVAKQSGEYPAAHSLINATDEFYSQTKAMNVWWMLRDLVGETAFTAALHKYNAAEDKDALYIQKLFETQSHKDLTWFFDDWVYRDRGLPDLRIPSVFARPVVSGGYIVTVTVENLGGAAAEVPVTLQMVSGEATEKLLVAAKSKESVRITAGSTPMKATVNDGSVPESDITNNTYTIGASELNH
jgi:hypothetical protein